LTILPRSRKSHYLSWAWWCMPAIPALWRLRQEIWEFEVILHSQRKLKRQFHDNQFMFVNTSSNGLLMGSRSEWKGSSYSHKLGSLTFRLT
jgi:hypothetical protein